VRILYHHRTQADDGQAVHIRSLIEAFRAEGHVVEEVALVERAGEAPGQSAQSCAAEAPSSWAWIGHVPRFARELAEYAYSVPARTRLVRAGRRFAPDFIYERYAFGNTAGVGAAERLGVPLVLEVNSPMVLELGRTRGLSFPRLASRVETDVFRRATRVCVVTEVLKGMLVEMGVPAERVFVTPNGVHPELYAHPERGAARADLGIAHAAGPVLGFVGYYRDWHRLDLVLDGLARPGLADAHLVLVGAGPAEADLRARAARLGLEQRVHFAGTRPHARIPAILPAFDVALVPAINPYASPLKLHEYMAAGLPTVAPDQPNLREVLTHEQDALLVPPGDGEALLAALERLVADAALRAALGAAARAAIEEQDLTWRGNARRVLAAVGALAAR
jgi:glycosyltransferase involved in cell wall biosynthesis